jgi:hypothetical protein
MELPSGVTVVQIFEGTRFLAAGGVVRTKIVKYMVGQHGPFTLELTPDQDNDSYVQGVLTDARDKIASLVGATL